MVSAQLIGFLACSTRSRRPAGEIKARAFIAAKIFVAAENRRALWQIALALRVEDHLFLLSHAAAPARTWRPFAPEEIEVEQGEK